MSRHKLYMKDNECDHCGREVRSLLIEVQVPVYHKDNDTYQAEDQAWCLKCVREEGAKG